MKILLLAVTFLLLPFGFVSAATDYYLKIDGVEGETTTRATTTQTIGVSATPTSGTASPKTDTGTVQSPEQKPQEAKFDAFIKIDDINGESGSSSTKKGGNVEYNWKVEEGEKGGTEDLNIGIGEQKNSTSGTGGDKVSTSDTSLKGGVSVAAGDVNGLTEEEKQTFLASVKAHAEVQSEQDLSNFAKGVLLENEQMEEISLNYEKITFKYRTSGKLFGLIPLSFRQEVELNKEGGSAGRVKVKMPWYSFLLKTEVSTTELENEIGSNEKWIKGTNENWDFAGQAEILSTVSNILKTKHDTAKNSVGNIR